ncbi:MAG: mitochondrial small ribosomal subunit protein uS9m [Chlamydiia bacterium]|nr:mitochondrial small ribosomal subunit protein uS9m [Chlamydiia bacterium]
MTNICKSGKRKASVANVRLFIESVGDRTGILINGKNVNEYFSRKIEVYNLMQPMVVADMDMSNVIVKIVAKGGGTTAQSEAIKLALSRAIFELGGEKATLIKESGFLRADCRKKERKKYGMKGPRAKRQFSKR